MVELDVPDALVERWRRVEEQRQSSSGTVASSTGQARAGASGRKSIGGNTGGIPSTQGASSDSEMVEWGLNMIESSGVEEDEEVVEACKLTSPQALLCEVSATFHVFS